MPVVDRRGKLARAAVAVVVAAAIVGVAAGVPIVVAPDREPVQPPTTPPEFDPDTLAPDPIPAEGSVAVERGGDAVILVDHAHGNRLNRGDWTPLATALTRNGAEIRSLYPGRSLEFALQDADALVIADPREPYSASELDALETFVEDGGRLLIAAEPNQRALASGLDSVGLQTQRSRVTELGARFGIAFGTGYLYHLDPAATDGNFKNVIVSHDAVGGPFDGVETGVVYTATPVWASDGRSLLTAREGTQLSSSDETRLPVAATARDGNVLAIGDTSFLEPGHHAVGDNERLIADLAEFLLTAEAG